MKDLRAKLHRVAEVGRKLGNADSEDSLRDILNSHLESSFGATLKALQVTNRAGDLIDVGPAADQALKARISETLGQGSATRWTEQRPEGACEAVALPLAPAGNRQGLAVIESPRLDEQDMDLLALTLDAGLTKLVALQTEKRERSVRRRAELLALAMRTTAQGPDPESVLSEVLDIVREDLDAPRCAVLLTDRTTNDLVLSVASGYGLQRGSRIPIEKGITGRVAREGTPSLVADVLTDSDYITGVSGGRCEMAAPLQIDGQTIGVLDVESTEVDAFSLADLDLLETVAAQVASAVRNAQLHEESAKRARRMALLNEAGRALTEVMVPDILLGQILRLARDALSFSHCAILLLDEQSGDLVVRAALGYGEIVGKRIPKGQGISADVIAMGKAVLVADVLKDSRYVPGVAGGRTEMVAPVVIDGQVVGILDAESPDVSAYDADDLELLAAFAAQAGAALRNARLLDRLEKRGARLSIIHRVSQAISTVLNPDQVLEEILRLARGALAFSRSAIALVDPKSEELVVRAAVGYGDILGKRIPIKDSITGTVVRTGEPELVRDVFSDARYVPGSEGARCEMVAPLRVRGEVIGILDAESEQVGAFSEQDLELLSVFAVHAATAIHNARLFGRLEEANQALRKNLMEMERLNQEVESSAQQLKDTNNQLERQVRQLKALHQAGQAMTATLDLDSTLEAILAMTREIISTSQGTIKLVDEETQEMRVRATAGRGTKDEPHIDLPLRIGDRIIGVFELAASSQLGDEERRLLETMASQAAVAIENARLFEDTQRTYYETLRSLASALEARDTYTRGHSERVARLSVGIAERLGLTEPERREIYSAALLHDIGKIGVRDDILLKPASLTEDEMAVIRSHPELGDAILGPIKFLERVSGMVKHHHERWDGEGYPDGLCSRDIPLPSRIVAVADAFDALTSDRPYRDRMQPADALAEIRQHSGTQFDPEAVQALLAVVDE